ncbi:MAG TPA: hypothetical protein VH253_17080 [Phycisphaerae bacterium]|nr:hypothetical protein [Phycisphaerae bacterium]
MTTPDASSAAPVRAQEKPVKKHCPASLGRKILRDGAVVLAVVGMILAWGIFRRPTQGAMLYYQYRAMHDGPRSGAVYWTTPALRAFTVKAMTHFGEDNDAPGTGEPDGPGAAPDDNCVPLPPHLVPPGGAGDPPALAKLNGYMQYVLGDGLQVVFCHELTSPDGLKRLVIVTVGAQRVRGGLFPPLMWEAEVIEPAGWTTLPHEVSRQQGGFDGTLLAGAPATFYGGKVDEKDGATCVVPYRAGGEERELRFSLLSGGRKLVMRDE